MSLPIRVKKVDRLAGEMGTFVDGRESVRDLMG